MTVDNQGLIVIERGEGNGFLMMFPNGDVCWKSSAKSAEAKARQWFKENLQGSIGVGKIEWR